MFKSSILWRLYAGFVATILSCALVIYFLLSQYIQENAKQVLEENLSARADFLKEISLPILQEVNLQKANWPKGDSQQTRAPYIVDFQERVTNLDRHILSRLTVIEASGTVIADSRQNPLSMDNHLSRPEIQEALNVGLGHAERYSNSVEENMQYLSLPVLQENKLLGFVRVALPLKEIREGQKELTKYILTGCLLASIIALIIGFYFARRFSLPILALTKSAEAIAAGNYQQRVYLINRDELGKLARSFNFMAASANDRVKRITDDRNKLATILSGLVEGVIAVDAQQNIIHINDAAARTLKISASASIGSSVWSSIHIVEIHEILKNIFTEGGISQDLVCIPGDHKDTVIEVYGAALIDSSTNVDTDIQNAKNIGAILVLHDVSELKMLENIRRDFVTNASHELKTPLTAIRGVVETILYDPEMDKETMLHFLQRVQGQTERLVSIVSDLMALSRLESDKRKELEPVSVHAILKQSIKSFHTIALEKNVQLIFETDDFQNNQSRLLGDAHSLGQLFDNLIDNAIKYTPAKGKVKVYLLSEQIDNQSWAIIQVKDDGLGIGKTDQSRIFERFYRVDKGRSRELGGTGLGLAIAKHIAEQHQGNIQIDSILGSGSTFTVQLPLSN